MGFYPLNPRLNYSDSNHQLCLKLSPHESSPDLSLLYQEYQSNHLPQNFGVKDHFPNPPKQEFKVEAKNEALVLEVNLKFFLQMYLGH